MRDLISNARRKGYALLEQQLERKVRGIGVPIRTRNAGIVGAIGISLAMEKETADHALSRALPLLQEAEYSLRTLL
jgi:DNA-binding IclR family transcriptional regulator